MTWDVSEGGEDELKSLVSMFAEAEDGRRGRKGSLAARRLESEKDGRAGGRKNEKTRRVDDEGKHESNSPGKWFFIL